MTKSELNSMTVLQLRKLARENNVVLGAGIDKNGIVDKIAAVLTESEEQFASSPDAGEPLQLSMEDLPAEEAAASSPETAASPTPMTTTSSSVPSASPSTPAASSTPAVSVPRTTEEHTYQAAWHSTDSPLGGSAHAASGIGAVSSSRPAWQNAAASRPVGGEQRPPILRSNSFHRFGPAASAPKAESTEAAAPAAVRSAASPLPSHRMGSFGPSFGPRAATAAPAPHSEEVPESEPAVTPAAAPMTSPAPFDSLAENSTPSLEELLASGDYEEGSGVLELHPDGYGFLRASNFLPSSRDIYVSMAQIRRLGLRTGDLIQGKVRPQREGDKYAALLYIDTINGVPEAENLSRPLFDELTPIYPSRRISLEFTDKPSLPDMRLIDLIAPLGFGQRGLILCPPDTGKMHLLENYARVITENDPDVHVLMLLIDKNPEDVTLVREAVPCQVLASTFDQSPESHLRLTEMVLERAMRLVEQKKDVVILVDSLTRLAKIYTTAAVQQGRSVSGMVNPSSLFRAKKLFGAARACREGGSLTLIAAMDIATGSRVDDSVVEEFKGTANMELVLDQAVAKAGVSPAINLQRSFTKNADLLLNDQQKEGLSLIRQMLGTTPSAVAIPQLLSMMDKAGTNSDLLLKMKDWFAIMNR